MAPDRQKSRAPFSEARTFGGVVYLMSEGNSAARLILLELVVCHFAEIPLSVWALFQALRGNAGDLSLSEDDEGSLEKDGSVSEDHEPFTEARAAKLLPPAWEPRDFSRELVKTIDRSVMDALLDFQAGREGQRTFARTPTGIILALDDMNIRGDQINVALRLYGDFCRLSTAVAFRRQELTAAVNDNCGSLERAVVRGASFANRRFRDGLGGISAN